MNGTAKEKACKVGRTGIAMPKSIDDTPKNAANVILSTPPKKRSEWRFMQQEKNVDNRSAGTK